MDRLANIQVDTKFLLSSCTGMEQTEYDQANDAKSYDRKVDFSSN